MTPVRDRTGPSRLLDMVEGRSKQVFKQWLDNQSEAWRSRIEVVAMDGFTGFKTAATEALPQATEVMDPYPRGRLSRGQARRLSAPRPARDHRPDLFQR